MRPTSPPANCIQWLVIASRGWSNGRDRLLPNLARHRRLYANKPSTSTHRTPRRVPFGLHLFFPIRRTRRVGSSSGCVAKMLLEVKIGNQRSKKITKATAKTSTPRRKGWERGSSSDEREPEDGRQRKRKRGEGNNSPFPFLCASAPFPSDLEVITVRSLPDLVGYFDLHHANILIARSTISCFDLWFRSSLRLVKNRSLIRVSFIDLHVSCSILLTQSFWIPL